MKDKIQRLLTADESKRLESLEAAIKAGATAFVEVGLALAEIRDSKLYRTTHKTFEDYCKDKWGWSSSRARQLIDAADIAESVTMVTLNERQARELAKVPATQRKEVVEKAASRGRVTAKAIRDAAATTPEQEQPKPTQDAEFVAACGRPKLPKLPLPLIEAMDLAFESLRLAKDADFEPEFEAMHQIAKDVRKAANELDRYAKTMFEREEA